MFSIRLLPVLMTCMFCFACRKENGKYEYTLKLTFDSGDTFERPGKIFEKKKRSKKYNEQIGEGFSVYTNDGKAFYFEGFDGLIFLKLNDDKLVCSDEFSFGIPGPVHFANEQTGNSFTGFLYLEGAYTQKGRAYTVENGVFEYKWTNASKYGMNDTILKGKWTLKR